MESRYEFRFYDRYKIREHPEYFFFHSIYRYILSGELRTQDLLEEKKDFETFAQKRDISDTPQARAAKDVRQLAWAPDTDEEASTMVTEFLRYAENGDYEFYEYADFIKILQGWVNWDLVELDMETIKKRILTGLQKSVLRPFGDMFFLRIDPENPMNLAGNDPDLQPIIEKRLSEAIAHDDNQDVLKLKDSIRSSSNDFWNTYAYREAFSSLSPEELLALSRESKKSAENLRRMLEFTNKYWGAYEISQLRPKLLKFLALVEESDKLEPRGFTKYFYKGISYHLKELIKKTDPPATDTTEENATG
jgi:hypothetical protein